MAMVKAVVTKDALRLTLKLLLMQGMFSNLFLEVTRDVINHPQDLLAQHFSDISPPAKSEAKNYCIMILHRDQKSKGPLDDGFKNTPGNIKSFYPHPVAIVEPDGDDGVLHLYPALCSRSSVSPRGPSLFLSARQPCVAGKGWEVIIVPRSSNELHN